MNKKINLLGILGGLGPMSSVYFYELLTSHTCAVRDQDHIDILISSHASTPDRTAFISGTSSLDPLPVMIKESRRLTDAGAELIAMPCNTAHCFYDALKRECSVPILNIIELTVKYAKHTGAKKIGVMATEGTIMSGAYESVCESLGIGYAHCPTEHQSALNDIIYKSIKCGSSPDIEAFQKAAVYLQNCGCDRLILGCTELSLIKRENPLPDIFIDSLDVLAACTIAACGKSMQGFVTSLEDFAVSQFNS